MAEIIAILKEIKFSMLTGRKCSLDYSYESEEDFSVIFETLIFDGVEGFKCTFYKACSIEMLEAYDKVVDIKNSEWLNEILFNLSKSEMDMTDLRHLRIYFDDGLCYEFICNSFQVVIGEQKNLFGNLHNSI